MTRVSHHVNFPKAAVSRGGRGQGVVVAPAALHAVHTPREANEGPVGARAGTGCLCVSARRGNLGEKVFRCAQGCLSGHYPLSGLSGG